MQYFLTAFWTFSAAHHLDETENHEQVHGHVYRVSVTCQVRYDQAKKRLSHNQSALWTDLAAILSELHNRDLNMMLTGAEPTLEGVAGWIVERMALTWPVVRCSVSTEDNLQVEVVRELR